MVDQLGLYGAGMTELDDQVGVLLKKLDDLGIAKNTIVIFTTDNGAEASIITIGALIGSTCLFLRKLTSRTG
jgi:arylsulfatase A-like enzyme